MILDTGLGRTRPAGRDRRPEGVKHAEALMKATRERLAARGSSPKQAVVEQAPERDFQLVFARPEYRAPAGTAKPKARTAKAPAALGSYKASSRALFSAAPAGTEATKAVEDLVLGQDAVLTDAALEGVEARIAALERRIEELEERLASEDRVVEAVRAVDDRLAELERRREQDAQDQLREVEAVRKAAESIDEKYDGFAEEVAQKLDRISGQLTRHGMG